MKVLDLCFSNLDPSNTSISRLSSLFGVSVMRVSGRKDDLKSELCCPLRHMAGMEETIVQRLGRVACAQTVEQGRIQQIAFPHPCLALKTNGPS